MLENYMPMSVVDLINPNSEESKQLDWNATKEVHDPMAWAKFYEEKLSHRIAKLKEGKNLHNEFSVGLEVPEDFTVNLGQEMGALCKKKRIPFCHFDCRNATSLQNLAGYLTTLNRSRSAVILLEHCDEIPSSPEKKYIKNALIKTWEKEFIVPRNRFLVLFTTSNCNYQRPDEMWGISTLDWYDNIREFDPYLSEAVEERCGMMQCLNAHNEVLFEFPGTEVRSTGDSNLYMVKGFKKWSLWTANGEKVTPYKFLWIKPLGANDWMPAYDSEKHRWVYIDKQGKEVLSCDSVEVEGFRSNGLARVGTQDTGFSYINEQGKVVIPGPLRQMCYERFAPNGLAIVNFAEKKWESCYGYINTQGEVVIPGQFFQAESFAPNGLAAVNFSEKGNPKKWGFINAQGEVVIPGQFCMANSFAPNGLAAVDFSAMHDNEWGYINAQGEVVIPGPFKWAGNFKSNGLAVVRIDDDKKCVINEKGELLFSTKVHLGSWLSHGLIEGIFDAEKRGCFNETGEVVIPFQFERIEYFSGAGLAEVRMNGKWGCINTKGEMVVPCEYSYLSTWDKNGLIFVKK